MTPSYRKTRQGVVEKEKLVMATLPSRIASKVNTMSTDLVNQFASIIGDKTAVE